MLGLRAAARHADAPRVGLIGPIPRCLVARGLQRGAVTVPLRGNPARTHSEQRDERDGWRLHQERDVKRTDGLPEQVATRESRDRESRPASLYVDAAPSREEEG